MLEGLLKELVEVAKHLDSEDFVITLDDRGLLTATNIHTGRTIKLEKELGEALFGDDDFIRAVDKFGNVVLVPKTMNIESLKLVEGKRGGSFEYSPLIAERICHRVLGGEGIMKICLDPAYPSYAQICRWRREHPEFKDMYEMSLRDRAEVYVEKAMDIIEAVDSDRDEVSRAKLQTDFLKYLAKVGNPDRYSERTNIKADVLVGVAIVDTGIRRAGDEGYNNDECLNNPDVVEVIPEIVDVNKKEDDEQ